jgi:hypothetical protein
MTKSSRVTSAMLVSPAEADDHTTSATSTRSQTTARYRTPTCKGLARTDDGGSVLHTRTTTVPEHQSDARYYEILVRGQINTEGNQCVGVWNRRVRHDQKETVGSPVAHAPGVTKAADDLIRRTKISRDEQLTTRLIPEKSGIQRAPDERFAIWICCQKRSRWCYRRPRYAS